MDESSIKFEVKKKAPVFNNIDEYESYLSDKINYSLSIFQQSMKDFRLFKKIFEPEGEKKEVDICENVFLLFQEIKESPIFCNKLINNVKNHNNGMVNDKPEKKRAHYYFSKENGTNLAVTELLNPFEQKEIANELIEPRLFSKKSEISEISSIISEKIQTIAKKKFEIAFEEGVEAERWTNDGIAINRKEEDKKGESKIISPSMRRIIIQKSINRLYPKPIHREGMDDQFFVDKINEYNSNGNYLSKKVNFSNLYKELKIPQKEDFKGDPLNDIKLADDVINSYLNDKSRREKNNSKINVSKKNEEEEVFKRGDLFFEKKDFLITKSKIYIKVDRKDKFKDFKIMGEPLNNESKFF